MLVSIHLVEAVCKSFFLFLHKLCCLCLNTSHLYHMEVKTFPDFSLNVIFCFRFSRTRFHKPEHWWEGSSPHVSKPCLSIWLIYLTLLICICWMGPCNEWIFVHSFHVYATCLPMCIYVYIRFFFSSLDPDCVIIFPFTLLSTVSATGIERSFLTLSLY